MELIFDTDDYSSSFPLCFSFHLTKSFLISVVWIRLIHRYARYMIQDYEWSGHNEYKAKFSLMQNCIIGDLSEDQIPLQIFIS